MAISPASVRRLSQEASSVVLSPDAVAAIRSSLRSSPTPLSFCAGCCAPSCDRSRVSLEELPPIRAPEGLPSFLRAVHGLTRSALYICLPVSGASVVPLLSVSTITQEPSVRSTIPPGDGSASCVAGRAPREPGLPDAANTPSLCCQAFKAVHYVYTLLSQQAPEGPTGACVYVLPVEASGEWRLAFRNAILAHLRMLQLSETVGGTRQAGGGGTPQADGGTAEELTTFLNVVDPHFRFTDVQFASCAPTVVLAPTTPTELPAESFPVTPHETTSSLPHNRLGTQESFNLAPASLPVSLSAPAAVPAVSSPSDAARGSRRSGLVTLSTPESSTTSRGGRSERSNANGEVQKRGHELSRRTGQCPSCCGKLSVELSPAVKVGEGGCSSGPCYELGFHAQVHSCCGTRLASLGGLSHVVVAGAFDRLHAGHKLLLTAAALLTQSALTIAVTAGALVSKKVTDSETSWAAGIEPFCARSSAACGFAALVLQAAGRRCVLHNYTQEVLSEEFEGVWQSTTNDDAALRAWHTACHEGTYLWPIPGIRRSGTDSACFLTTWLQAVDAPELVPVKSGFGESVGIRLCRLLDPVGPAADLEFDGLVVSSESLAGGCRVNDERRKRNNPPVLLIRVEPIPALPRDASKDPVTAIAQPSPSDIRNVVLGAERHGKITRIQVCCSTKLSSTDLRLQQAKVLTQQADIRSLVETFDEAVSTVVNIQTPVRAFLWNQLCRAYSVPWRRFFTLQRLARLLSRARSLAVERLHLTPQQTACVEVAFWFAYAVHTPPSSAVVGQSRAAENSRRETFLGSSQGSEADGEYAAVLLQSLFRDSDISSKFVQHVRQRPDQHCPVPAEAPSDLPMATHTFRITGGEPHEVCCCIQDCVKSARAACPFLMNPPPSVGFSRSKQSSTFSAFAEDCCNAVRFVEYLDFAVPPEEFSSELVPRLRQEYFLVSDAEFESTRKLRLEQWLRENSTSALSCTGLLPSEICLLRANLEREVQCPRTGASRD